MPTPKAGEILVKIEAASVNPVDWKIQTGNLRPFLPSKLPYIPGILYLEYMDCVYMFVITALCSVSPAYIGRGRMIVLMIILFK